MDYSPDCTHQLLPLPGQPIQKLLPWLLESSFSLCAQPLDGSLGAGGDYIFILLT